MHELKIVPKDYIGTTIAIKKNGDPGTIVTEVITPLETVKVGDQSLAVTIVKPVGGKDGDRIIIPFSIFLHGGTEGEYTVVEGVEVDARVRYAPATKLEKLKTQTNPRISRIFTNY